MSEPDLQPTLTGSKVQLRPIRAADWTALFTAAADPLIWEQHPEPDRYQEAVFRKYFHGALSCGSGFVIVDRRNGRIIGSTRYNGYDPELSEIEIGWSFLARDYWGGGYNPEAKRLLLEHAFGFVDKVVFWVGRDNHRSRRAMEKIGGVLRKGVHARAPIEDQPHVVFEIRKPLR